MWPDTLENEAPEGTELRQHGCKIVPWRPLGGLWRPGGALGGLRQIFERFGGRILGSKIDQRWVEI